MSESFMPPSPPQPKRIAHERVTHGHRFVDNYEWLRDKESPDTVAYLTEENAYTEKATAHLAPLRDAIFSEIKTRTQETDLSVPVREGAWWYFARTVEGEQYGRHCRIPIRSNDDWTPPQTDTAQTLPGEQLLLNSNVEAGGHEFFSLGSFDVSPDGSLLLYTVDTVGDERYTLHVRDANTGEPLSERVAHQVHSALFTPDGASIVYTTVDDAWRPDTVWRHVLGTAPESDSVVFSEADERFWVGIGMTRSEKFLEIGVGSKITSESWLIHADDPSFTPHIVWKRREGVEYSVEHAVLDGDDRLLILHNDNAENFELVSVSADNPGEGPHSAAVLLSHDPARRLEDVSAFASYVTVEYRREGLTRVAIGHLAENSIEINELPFTEPLYTVGTGANPEWEQPCIRLGYGSLITPACVYDYEIATGTKTLLKQQPVLGGYDPSAYRERREWAETSDGEKIPISLVWKAAGDDETAERLAEAAPLVLYGYGSYEASLDPAFSVSRLSLLDRGVIFAIAHVRGGGEMGRGWYENGKTLTKKNTFTDFIACAEHLIARGWTTPDQLVAEGGSAGGLLMGAVTNMAPGLFAGVLAEVPFVDPLTSMLDPSLPLTVIEWDEWGNPLDDFSVYDYMRSYSPYENVVSDTEYPRVLAVTSLNDTRVLYVEPAKWVARLREVGAPALLKTEMSAGHGGVSGRYEAWRERAFELAWILDVLGRAELSSHP